MLQAGSSKPWPEVLEKMTGSKKMQADAILEYFQPLEAWLDKEIQKDSIPVGWNSTIDNFFPDPSPATTTPATTPNTTSESSKLMTSYFLTLFALFYVFWTI